MTVNLTKSRKGKRSGKGLRWLLAGVLLLVVVVAGGVGYGYWWVSKYVQSDGFRVMLAEKIGEAAKSKAELDDLSITGPFVHVSRARLTPLKLAGWEWLGADRLQATVGLSRWKQQVVEVDEVSADKVVLRMRAKADRVGELPLVEDPEVGEVKVDNVPSWLKRWMPNRTEIRVMSVEDFELVPGQVGGVSIRGLQLSGTPVDGDVGVWQLKGKGGRLKLPASEEVFRFESAAGRVGREGLVLHDSVGKWVGDAEVTARGELPFEQGGKWRFEGTYRELEVGPFLSEELRRSVSGKLSGVYDVNAQRFFTQVEMVGGVVQNLPLLERVADFTRTAQFRRLVLDEARAEVTKVGGKIQMRKLVLHSRGLVRVEGNVDVDGRLLAGDLYVGVTTSALRWIPGSQSRVFTEDRAGSEPGFVWTRVRLSGTLDAPKEDLSNRLLAAMGKALILDAPLGAAGVGVDILKGAGGGGGEAVGAGAEAGGTVIEEAGKAAEKAVEKGADLLKKVIPGL